MAIPAPLLDKDGAPSTPCHGTWPMGRSPWMEGYGAGRFTNTTSKLTDLLLAGPWCHLWCHVCRKDLTP